MNARRAAGAVALAVILGGALMAAGAALPLPPVGSPNQLGSWWADRGPAVAAFSVVRLAGLIGAGYLALVGSVALLGALTRWRWTLSLSKLAAQPGLMRFLVGGSLVATLSTPSEAAARPGPLLTVTDTGPAAAAGPDTASAALTGGAALTGSAALTVADLGPGVTQPRPGGASDAALMGNAALTVADLGPETMRSQPAAAMGPDTGSAALTIADFGLGVTRSRPATATEPDTAGAALTVGGLSPEAMRSRPAEAAAGLDTAGASLSVADLGPSQTRAQPAAESLFTFPSAEVRTAMTGVADSGAEVTAADNRPSELRTAEAAEDSDAETWIVEAGDHLWAIAAETVADRTGHTDDESVGAYWQRLIDANRHIVGDDPDLIHPGQIIELPE